MINIKNPIHLLNLFVLILIIITLPSLLSVIAISLPILIMIGIVISTVKLYKKSPLKLLLLLSIFVGLLAITNPNTEEFTSYYKKNPTDLHQMLHLYEIASEGNLKIRPEKTVERKNRFIYSLYSINVMGIEHKYLGVFNRFIEITL